jgi:4-amino-4-deoxy-L-arabinose transferase-like glycosyltransferase
LSGAVFLWPPLGSIGYDIGGITGARFISLLLALGTTSLVYLTALRISERRLTAAFAAAFAGITGLGFYVAASSTFEPLATFLLMLSVYLIIRANGRWPILVAAGAVLALATMAKYAVFGWIPVALGIVLFYRWRSVKGAFLRLGIVAGTLLVADTLLLLAAGASGRHGLIITTLARRSAGTGWPQGSRALGCPGVCAIAVSPLTVLSRSAALTGFVLAAALTAVIISVATKREWPWTALLGVMTASLLVVPVDQAHLHDISSIDRNLSIGLPIGAIAAGIGVVSVIGLLHHDKTRVLWVAPIAAMLVVGLLFPWQAIRKGGALTREAHEAALVEHHYRPHSYIGAVHGGDVNALELLLSGKIPEQAWVFTTARSRFMPLFREHKISEIVVFYWRRKPQVETQILRLLRRTPGWVLLKSFGKGQTQKQVWIYRGRG